MSKTFLLVAIVFWGGLGFLLVNGTNLTECSLFDRIVTKARIVTKVKQPESKFFLKAGINSTQEFLEFVAIDDAIPSGDKLTLEQYIFGEFCSPRYRSEVIEFSKIIDMHKTLSYGMGDKSITEVTYLVHGLRRGNGAMAWARGTVITFIK